MMKRQIPIDPLLEDLDGKIDSRYRLVKIVADRARAIQDGYQPLVADTAGKKPTTIALQEFLEGLLEYRVDPGEEDDKPHLKPRESDMFQSAD